VLNPFALPVHPILVHFSIAMLTAAWFCLLARYATGNERWDERWRLFELVGVLTLPLTIVTAFIDTRGFTFLIHPRTEAPLIWHMVSGLVATAAFGTHYLWRRRKPTTDLNGASAVRDVALATLGMLALVASGLIAAEMVYGT
jgi:uncharacterized membrane protein